MATLKINRGTTYIISVHYQKDGIPTSLQGSTVRFTMKNSEYDSDTTDSSALVRKDVSNGDETGNISIILEPNDTASLAPNDYFYDIKVDETSDGKTIYKIDEGKVRLDASPTNRL